MCAHRKCSVRAMAAGVSLSSATGMKTSLVAFIPTPKVPGEIKRSRDLEEGGGAGPSS